MRTDKIFYSLFQAFPSIFFDIIGDTTVNPNTYEFVSVELKETAFRIDGVFVPATETTKEPVYFVEVQFQLDSNFYRRFFAEIFLYLRQNASVKFWRAVVIYPNQNLDPDDQQPYRLLLDSPQVQRIYLDELGTAAENSLQLSIVELIIESEETAVERGRELILQARQQLADEATRTQIVELIETILLYKFTQLSREELAAMLGIDDEFRKTRMYQSIKEEGLEEGRQEGLQEGRQEGLQEGKLQAKLDAVPRLLGLGLSVKQVARALDLTLEQVQQAVQNH
ncbi:MAG: Rpn family recombination-promoting nuclease/putative transposase [Scytonema sp. RU_4_4]|nr:Rpn family recombination-promoting nuclease/putative transposase [Scytonema sp. RU_4_4]NJR76018.1 Rpn family recombination-promoting nuclease/putative transposase [Scytonema sp. CRU_2_7]